VPAAVGEAYGKHKVIFAPIKEYWQSIAEGRTYRISFYKEQYFETFFKVISKKPR
jgi:hypothetical protein